MPSFDENIHGLISGGIVVNQHRCKSLRRPVEQNQRYIQAAVFEKSQVLLAQCDHYCPRRKFLSKPFFFFVQITDIKRQDYDFIAEAGIFDISFYPVEQVCQRAPVEVMIAENTDKLFVINLFRAFFSDGMLIAYFLGGTVDFLLRLGGNPVLVPFIV